MNFTCGFCLHYADCFNTFNTESQKRENKTLSFELLTHRYFKILSKQARYMGFEKKLKSSMVRN